MATYSCAHKSLALLTCVLLVAISPRSVRAADPDWIARDPRGMVAADHADASAAGAAILRSGGNAFDAAIATSLALTVTRPASTGIGGGGFLVAFDAKSGKFVALDFRETAPRAATPERYAALAKSRGDGPSASIYGGHAIAIPGLLRGLDEIHRRFGSRPWRDLVQPAIDLAERGYVIDEHHHATVRDARREIEQTPALQPIARVLRERLLGGDREPAIGDRCTRTDLAETLRQIAEIGPNAFYEGEIAEDTVGAVASAGGEMTLADLRGYRVRELEPLRSRYRDIELIGMRPPSSGGACIAETLNILDASAARPELASAPRIHLLVESLKHSFADRARHFADPDFYAVPVGRLTSRDYAAQLAARIRPDGTLTSDAYGSAADAPTSQPRDDRGTSHFSIADEKGNLIAMTETINGTFGSLVMTERFGILLNNQMDDFLTVPGEANLFGLTQSEHNLVGPGKRPLSSMSPTIVLKNGKPLLIVGGSGGPRIITATLQVILGVLDGKPLAEAMDAPRVHHQWQPDEVLFDRPAPQDLSDQLRTCGHKVSDRRRGAAVQAIHRLDDGIWLGASDPRKGGKPVGASVSK
ncbi:MAG: gamma-glutamyltransferase [Phycisphaerae bacterium]